MVELRSGALYEYRDCVPLFDEPGQPNVALDGHACCDQITPDPPGNPVLVPGQRTTPSLRVLAPGELEAMASRTVI